MAIVRVPVYIVPQITDEEWEIITSLSEPEQLQLLSNNLAMEDEFGHQITMYELPELMKEALQDGC